MSEPARHHHIYDPELDRPVFEPGVTTGYVYLWNGEPGPAHVATAIALTDPDGHGFIEITSDFAECTVSDDGKPLP